MDLAGDLKPHALFGEEIPSSPSSAVKKSENCEGVHIKFYKLPYFTFKLRNIETEK